MLDRIKTFFSNLFRNGESKVKELLCRKLDDEKPVLAKIIRDILDKSLNPDMMANEIIERIKVLVNKL